MSRPGRGLRRTVYLVTSKGESLGLEAPSITVVNFPIKRGEIGSEAIRSRAIAVKQP